MLSYDKMIRKRGGRKKWNAYQRKKQADFRKKNREKWNERSRTKRKLERLMVMNEYGNACKCCGENEDAFLVIDHIHNGKGNPAVRYKPFYGWLIKNNYPKDNFQILCHNCNAAKANHGTCPHKKRKKK